MDYDSPDVAKDFPGLYASECGKKSNESDFSDGDHDKLSKKDLLIGRKKDHKKDRGYAALEGESSLEEDDNKSGPKLKKSKAFKFSTKNKEKREKSHDKCSEKDKEKEKDGKDDKDKKKDKDKKDKDRKDKKDKEKKDKKLKHSAHNDDSMDLADVQPIFGVPLELSVKHSKCHDSIALPVVVRNCIDYIQELGLTSDLLYKVECSKTKLQCLKKLYNNHENVMMDDLDIPTACSLLKSYLKELPDSILTSELTSNFEEASSMQNTSQRSDVLLSLLEQLPPHNKTLLSWIIIHFDNIIKHERFNKFSAQSLSVLMGPILSMSPQLLKVLLYHCKTLFPGLELNRYVPPLSSATLVLPDSSSEIVLELQKQESLLAQIHSEMNAGFVSTKREEQLWEVQRLITQLKRKLRLAEKRSDNNDKTIDEEQNVDKKPEKVNTSVSEVVQTQTVEPNNDFQFTNSNEAIALDDKLSIGSTKDSESDKNESTQHSINQHKESGTDSQSENIQPDVQSGFIPEKTELTPDELQYVQMKVEHNALLKFVSDLQTNINNERADVVKLRSQIADLKDTDFDIVLPNYVNIENLISAMMEENEILEQRRINLIRELFKEKKKCIELKVELAMLNISEIY